MCGREPRLSETILDNIFKEMRSMGNVVWQGNVNTTQDVEEYITCIKRDLDGMLNVFKLEMGKVVEEKKIIPTAFSNAFQEEWHDPILSQKEWRCTPTIDPPKKV